MNAGDMALVQTPSYPQSTINSVKNVTDCKFTFARKDNQPGNIYFIFVNGYTTNYSIPNVKALYLTNGFMDGSIYYSNYILAYSKNENVTAVTYENQKGSSNIRYSAIQAFVYVPELNEPQSNCFMNGKNFDLINSWQVVPIFGISNQYKTTEACFWNFTIANGLSLKVVVNNMEANETATLTDDAGGVHPLTVGVMYFNGSKFGISYTKTPQDYIQSGLGAFVSAVDLKIPPTNSLCTVRQEYDDNYKKNVTHISTFDSIKGYAVNTIYSATATYKPNTAMSFSLNLPLYEYLGDQLLLSSGGETHVVLNSAFARNIQIKEGNNVNIQFISDQNTVGAGFGVDQVDHDCKCPNENVIVPCNNSLLFFISDVSYTYCSNMTCKFTVTLDQQCKNNKIKMATTALFRRNAGDSFNVLKDGVLYKSYTSTVSQDVITFDPNVTVQAIFLSGQSPAMFVPQPEFQLVLSMVEYKGDGGNAGLRVAFSILMLILTVLLWS
uniref:CUB-like domain-containing protein n=1 Tax=Panagrolaimus sp. JU765 TaxID=591449 RepID=A0AC34QWF6_9BILA